MSGSRFAVRVQPGARRDALLGRLASGEWKLAVSAPPEAGRANEAVLDLLAGLLGIRRQQLGIARGAGSRRKLIELTGMDAAEAARRLEAALPAPKGNDGE